MQNFYVRKIVTRVNSDILEDFYKTADYLTKVHKKCGNYDNSIAFKYTISEFNKKFNDYPYQYWINEIELYNSRIKKDKQISIWLRNKPYIEFINNCDILGINRVKVIRSLMLKLIEETKIE